MPIPAITLPAGTAPSNLVLPPGIEPRMVESDVYGICERVAEISPRLKVVVLEGQEHPFAIMESCDDGVERLVFKVRELDNRVVEKLRRIMAMPLSERLRQIERDERRFKEQERERELEELYERVGRPMWTLLDRCGFLEAPRGVSYPKAGVATRGRMRR